MKGALGRLKLRNLVRQAIAPDHSPTPAFLLVDLTSGDV